MRLFLKYLVLAMILVAIAGVSALTAMRFAIHGREVEVPRFVGTSQAEADKLAADHGLLIVRESKFFSAEIPAGRVVSQSPAAGARVRRGWRVRVAESLGPQRVQVPDVIGQSSRAAELNIRRRGLEVGTIAVAPIRESPPDHVIAQSPPPFAQGVASPKLSLLLPSATEPPSFVMPDLIGMTIGEASLAVSDAGLKLATVTAATAPTPSQLASPTTEGIVVLQFPLPGQKVTAGMSVTLEVRR